ncbi:MAG: cation diffusion facilitator family transporter [Candidatus Binatia bacterium]
MNETEHSSRKNQSHEDHTAHSHSHGVIEPTLAANERGIWALKWSFVGLLITALFQVVVVYFSGSVALLADTIHNFGDAATAVPLWIAFALARRKPSRQFTYGLGRVEDLAGVAIVLVILLSGIVAGYQSVQRLMQPQPVEYLWAVILASVVGFAGNEMVAIFRIRIGKEINSAALVADGYHARVDGLTSLAVLLGAIGVWLGFPLADPIIGLLIALAILKIVWDSSKTVFSRLLDGVEPKIIDELKSAAGHVQGVHEVSEVRGRWLGHRLSAEINITVPSQLSVGQAHAVALEVRHELLHHLSYLSNVTIHVDPVDVSGEEHHRIEKHAHDGLPAHSHK